MKSIVSLIVTAGVLWGVAMWAGDNEPLFSAEWANAVRAKVTNYQDGTEEYLDKTLPDPKELDIKLPIPTELVPPEPQPELRWPGEEGR